MKAVIIDGTTVLNVVAWSENDEIPEDFPHTIQIVSDDVQIAPGWVLQGGNYVNPNPPPAEPAPKVSVSARQLRLALLDLDLLDDVEALMADPSTPKGVKIEWEYANEFDRNNQLVVAFAAALQKSSEDVDNLFALAKSK